MQIGFIGLGKMGGNMVARIKRDSQHDVVAFDYNADAVAAAEAHGARGATSAEDLVAKLDAPRVVWIMVPPGEPTDSSVDALAAAMEPGDTIVDGGNSKWTDDKIRSARLAAAGINYLDAGTSGGVWGLDVGYCLMVGGNQDGVDALSPILDVLAPHDEAGGQPGWLHCGPSGAGHYTKMVHNGIEYGMMQAYAEGFNLLDACEYDIDQQALANLWNQGSVIRSWLLELSALAFEQEGNDLQELEPFVEDSGEGRWTVEDAIDKRVPLPVITESLYARFSSRGNADFANKVNAGLRAQFGGHAVKRHDHKS